MNREIKFRAWDSHEEKMYIQGNANDENRKVFWHEWENKIHISEPMQFTGLKDKNGKEIYEGDIVEWSLVLKSETFGKPDEIHKTKYKVIWEQGNTSDIVGFYFKRNDGKYIHFKNFDNIEIIGNIYQTPELLTK